MEHHLYLFYSLGQFVMFLDYVYYIGVQNVRCHSLNGLCFSLPKYSVLGYIFLEIAGGSLKEFQIHPYISIVVIETLLMVVYRLIS